MRVFRGRAWCRGSVVRSLEEFGTPVGAEQCAVSACVSLAGLRERVCWCRAAAAEAHRFVQGSGHLSAGGGGGLGADLHRALTQGADHGPCHVAPLHRPGAATRPARRLLRQHPARAAP
jgi:hypothetical protein